MCVLGEMRASHDGNLRGTDGIADKTLRIVYIVDAAFSGEVVKW